MVKNRLLVVVGILLVAAGAVWTAQGLGYLAGSAMTGVRLWAVIGPIVVIAGVAMLVVGLRRRPAGRPG